jgi:hypothetical protein
VVWTTYQQQRRKGHAFGVGNRSGMTIAEVITPRFITKIVLLEFFLPNPSNFALPQSPFQTGPVIDFILTLSSFEGSKWHAQSCQTRLSAPQDYDHAH